MEDCLTPVIDEVSRLIDDSGVDAEQAIDSLHESLLSGNMKSATALMEKLYVTSVINKEHKTAMENMLIPVIKRVKEEAEKAGVKIDQDFADEIFLSVYARGKLGQSVTNSLENAIEGIKNLNLVQFEEALGKYGFDADKLSKNTPEAQEFIEALTGTRKLEGEKAEAVDEIVKLFNDNLNVLKDLNVVPELTETNLTASITYDPVKVYDLAKSGELFKVFDDVIDLEQTAKNIQTQKDRALYGKLQASFRKNKDGTPIHKADIARSKELKAYEAIQKSEASENKNLTKAKELQEKHTADTKKLNEDIENLDSEMARLEESSKQAIEKNKVKTAETIEKHNQNIVNKKARINKLKADKAVKESNIKADIDSIKDKIVGLETKAKGQVPNRASKTRETIKTQKERLAKKQRDLKDLEPSTNEKIKSIEDSIKDSEARISEAKKMSADSIANKNEKLKKSLETRKKKLVVKKKKLDTSGAKLEKNLANVEKQLTKLKERKTKLGVSAEEYSKLAKEQRELSDKVTKDMFSSGVKLPVEKEVLYAELQDWILKAGYISPTNVSGVVALKTTKFTTALTKLSKHESVYSHVKQKVKNISAQIADAKLHGTDTQGGIRHTADYIEKNLGFAVKPEVLSNAEAIYVKKHQRNGVPTRLSRTLKFGRFLVNTASLGRAFMSMLPENAFMSARVGVLVGNKRVDTLIDGLHAVLGGWMKSVAKGESGYYVKESAKNFIEDSALLIETLPRFDDAIPEKAKLRGLIKRGTDRLAGMISAESSQRAVGMGNILATLNENIATGTKLSKELQATLEQFGFKDTEMDMIKEVGGWGDYKMLKYAEEKYAGNPEKLKAFRELANKQGSYLHGLSVGILARNNNRYKIISGIGTRDTSSDNFMQTITQYKQIMYEVTDNMVRLGVKGDGWTNSVKTISDGLIVSLGKSFKDPDVAYVLAVGTAITMASLEARRVMTGKTGWSSENYESKHFIKDFVTSIVSVGGGMTLGLEDITMGEFDLGNFATTILGPSVRHVGNVAELASATVNNVVGDGEKDLQSKFYKTLKQATPFKTHVLTSIAIDALYDMANEATNDNYFQYDKRRTKFMESIGQSKIGE